MPPTNPILPRRRRGRPRADDLAGLEARLIRVGSELFYKHGYGGTTMSAVAAAARVSKTTLYARFETKANLFKAIVAAQMKSWGTGVHHVPLLPTASLEESLRSYGDIVMRAGLTHDFVQVHRLMTSESERFPELGGIAEARFRGGVQFLAVLISDHARKEQILCRNPEAAAERFLMTLAGWNSVMIVGNRRVPEAERQGWLDDMVRIYVSSRASW